ncbi:MAG TPA: hypothetical protein VIP46_01020 [Pyrinomonadaceae bacterium]
MTAALSEKTPRFVRRTTLGASEYRKDFRQIDSDVIAAVTSAEADRVTPLMGKIYLRLVNAPSTYWEREGVLRFESGARDDGHETAWEALCEVAGVASATARKALQWMHGQGIVGYFAGKNGVGIRVFLNRASSSIGKKARGEKILEFPRTSSQAARTSPDEVAFSDSFADPEVLDTDLDPRAPKNGAEQTGVVNEHPDLRPARSQHAPQSVRTECVSPPRATVRAEVPIEEIVSRLRRELEPSLQSAARQAAAREHERTREWLESRGLPKAARVAQREAFDVLRKYGVISEAARGARMRADVGRNGYARPEPHTLSGDEVAGLAEACVAMLETKGQSVEFTLSEMSAEAGGFLLPEDAARVRERANSLLSAGDREGN